VPSDVGLIVGMPRSGLLAANLIALHLNLPLTDFEGFIENRILQTGERILRKNNYLKSENAEAKILLVDDSVQSGSTIRKAKRRLKEVGLDNKVIFSAIFVSPEGRSEVDLYFEEIRGYRIFEWNLMHSAIITNSCVDIDGVLCEDPTEEQNDDGERYEEFLLNAKPLHLPSVRIGCLVSCRLEKHRKLTEKWLKHHQIKYGKLYLMNLPNKEARLASNSHAAFKAEIYKSTNAILFIESSIHQAWEIAKIANSAVLCFETNKMIYPPLINYGLRKIPRIPTIIYHQFGKLASLVARRVFDIDPPKQIS
jgi:orotate phosphoribosyltransferase